MELKGFCFEAHFARLGGWIRCRWSTPVYGSLVGYDLKLCAGTLSERHRANQAYVVFFIGSKISFEKRNKGATRKSCIYPERPNAKGAQQ